MTSMRAISSSYLHDYSQVYINYRHILHRGYKSQSIYNAVLHASGQLHDWTKYCAHRSVSAGLGNFTKAEFVPTPSGCGLPTNRVMSTIVYDDVSEVLRRRCANNAHGSHVHQASSITI